MDESFLFFSWHFHSIIICILKQEIVHLALEQLLVELLLVLPCYLLPQPLCLHGGAAENHRSTSLMYPVFIVGTPEILLCSTATLVWLTRATFLLNLITREYNVISD
jgi:hypothetical protein